MSCNFEWHWTMKKKRFGDKWQKAKMMQFEYEKTSQNRFPTPTKYATRMELEEIGMVSNVNVHKAILFSHFLPLSWLTFGYLLSKPPTHQSDKKSMWCRREEMIFIFYMVGKLTTREVKFCWIKNHKKMPNFELHNSHFFNQWNED